ncbi:L-type lectin-domain containing receptor kinase SIT2-like [Miscanthus floridulus]|uniref:L-type lectin-domain containing receptor kinase SIT2-like n=1 Tax=Miscanthus floridulus TaxID=154761 RepID=UPI003457A9A3
MMFSKSLAFAIPFLLPLVLATIADEEFVFNGFNDSSGWDLQGSAVMLKNGILSLGTTNARIVQPKIHAFYPSPFQMRNLTDSSIFSFSATFAFSILPSNCDESPNSLYRYSSTGDGITFVIAPNTSFSNVTSYGSFGLLDPNDNGKLSNHLVSIELDIRYNREFGDIDDNHVGININSLNSSVSSPAGYYTDDTFSDLHPLRLSSGKEMQVWIDYDQRLMQLNVSLAPIPEPKPKHSLLSHTIDLSQVLLDYMYVGLSSSSWDSYSGFILGCSFKMNGEPASLDYSKLPRVNTTQPVTSRCRPASQFVNVLSILAPTLVFLGSAGTLILLVPIILVVRRCYRYREICEDWELEFGPHRFSYKDLFHATDGFKDKQLLGTGGFGKVYKGLLQLSKQEVAVKVLSHDSKQGMKEFVAEVVSMGRLRHRNLVQLLGYCRRKGELLLVYEYMPNGSLDKHLYNLDPEKPSLGWALRFEIIKGVASGLFYLHEEWEQVVIHRDVKASNVLLDGEMNGRLGDFGLARLHDHGVEAHTTCVAGTRGYISPELARLGKATKATDVFAFGAFILEVACGRRPVGVNSHGEPQLLVDFVLKFWQRDLIVCMMDPRLGEEYVMEEAKLVLKLGLLCSHPSPVNRPSMRLVMQYLCGDTPFPEMPDAYLNIRSMSELHDNEIASSEYDLQYTSVQTSISSLSGGR